MDEIDVLRREGELLRATLDTCQRELAAVREQQETWAEDLHGERRRRSTAEQRLKELSLAVNELLSRGPTPPEGNRSRGRQARQLAAQEAAVESCELFRGPWYLRRHPEVARTGLSPARHYLEVGADLGFDPGPRFSTSRYLAEHTEVATSGINPLLHHLAEREQVGPGARGGSPDPG